MVPADSKVRRAMLETAVEAERSQVVQAAPDRVWSLLASAPVWGLMSGACCGFDLLASPAAGPGHLMFVVGTAASGVSGSVYEVCHIGPGAMICVRTLSTRPVGARVYTLSLTPVRRGTRITAAVRIQTSRADEVGSVIRAREQFGYWLEAMRAVVENRVPWPGPAIPAEEWRAHLNRPGIADAMNISAAGLISAPVSAVWQALQSLEAVRMGMHAVFNGRVPGAPVGAPGEMRYAVIRQPDNGLAGIVTAVAEIDDQRSIRVRRVGKPHDETLITVASADAGTRLELSGRWPAPATPAERERLSAALNAELQARVDRYKGLIEESADMA
jgi:hypothetical protein